MKAQGVRIEWSEVAPAVRDKLATELGSPVVEARNQPGGFSPGVAARCRLADGRRCFIKAIATEPNQHGASFHRREAVVTAALPPGLPVPTLLATVDDGGWVVLVFNEIDGEPPRQPWEMADLAATFDALAQLSAATTPCPIAGLANVPRPIHGGLRFVSQSSPAVIPTRQISTGGRSVICCEAGGPRRRVGSRRGRRIASARRFASRQPARPAERARSW